MNGQRKDPVRPFIILFQARTGSTYLVEALDSHPQLKVEGEKFGEPDKKKRAERQLAKIRNYYSSAHDPALHAVGFKVKHRDVADDEQLAELLREVDARVILLGRRNRIKHAISKINSERLNDRTGDWNLYAESDRPSAFAVDPSELDRQVRMIEEAQKKIIDYVMALELPTLCLYYEDLLSDTEQTLALAQSFLGVPVMPLTGSAIKTTSDDLREALVNFDEVRSHYVNTPYARMLDEVLVS